MRNAFLATAAVLSMVAVPAMANPQDSHSHMHDHHAAYESMTEDQRSVFDTYDHDRKMLYFGWPAEVRSYFWTLSDKQKDTWWYLTDEQRISLFELDADAREARLGAFVTKIDAVQADGESFAYTTSVGTRDAQTAFVSQPVVQQVPVARAQHDGEYPVCNSDYDDHCINAWAAGLRGPDVDRPLGYWPGESITDTRSGG